MEKFGNIKNRINIRDIKSPFIIKNILSFLSEKRILNMIIYNKKIQNFMINTKQAEKMEKEKNI